MKRLNILAVTVIAIGMTACKAPETNTAVSACNDLNFEIKEISFQDERNGRGINLKINTLNGLVKLVNETEVKTCTYTISAQETADIKLALEGAKYCGDPELEHKLQYLIKGTASEVFVMVDPDNATANLTDGYDKFERDILDLIQEVEQSGECAEDIAGTVESDRNYNRNYDDILELDQK